MFLHSENKLLRASGKTIVLDYCTEIALYEICKRESYQIISRKKAENLNFYLHIFHNDRLYFLIEFVSCNVCDTFKYGDYHRLTPKIMTALQNILISIVTFIPFYFSFTLLLPFKKMFTIFRAINSWYIN